MTKTNFYKKILDPSDLTIQLTQIKSLGSIVFTNGVFDVIHRGHVTYLDLASQLGKVLIVALNTDSSARLLGKGEDRPLNTLTDRIQVIAALESVSYVTWFDEHTPLEIIKLVRPDILVKGGDYDMGILPETHFVKSYGGNAQSINFVDGYSTTGLIEKILKSKLTQL
jgi:rfaE bifunctional protein nucleotidyltransferase chain/domain